MAPDIKCKVVTWDEIDEWASLVAGKIESSGFKPDLVIGLTRGGWVPARMLCDALICKNLYSIKVEHWGITATTDNKAKLVQPLAIDIRGKKVLLVDDITDTGESLALSIKHIKGKRPKALKSATLLHIAHSKTEPDFYGVEVPKDEWRWFIFPWNFREDMSNLIGKLKCKTDNPKELLTLIKEKYTLDGSERVRRAVVDHLEKRGRK